jgi:alkylated DNA repair protein alkB family protein 4
LALDTISEEEEQELVSNIDSHPWMDSQSGRRKQDYGPKVNFKKKKCKTDSFHGLPSYSRGTFERLVKDHPQALEGFIPVELCHLEYEPSRGSAIDPHLDDTWLWGHRLVTLNYLSTTVLTMTLPHEEGMEVAIEMPPRSLLVLSGEARYSWLHAVKRGDVRKRRVATTWRELTPHFMPGGHDYDAVGKRLLQIAANYV